MFLNSGQSNADRPIIITAKYSTDTLFTEHIMKIAESKPEKVIDVSICTTECYTK